MELGLAVCLLEAGRIAYGKLPATLAAAGFKNLASAESGGALEESVAAQTFALLEFSDHSADF